MAEITLINISGQSLSSNVLYSGKKAWKGNLVSLGANKFGVIAGENIVALVEMPDYSETFGRVNAHAVCYTEGKTLFLFGKDGGYIMGDDCVILVTSDGLNVLYGATQEVAMIKNYLAGDYQTLEPKPITNAEVVITDYLKKR